MERRRSGRPAHEPTEATRARVVHLVSAGMDVPKIAKELGLSAPTLRAHYAAELHGAKPQKNFPIDGLQETVARPGRERAGRPEHVPTDDTRDRVEVLVAAGMVQWQIAQALGISEPVLRDRYADQLQGGRAKKRAEIIEAMHRSAREGNVSAQKAFLGMAVETDDPPLPPQAVALGKKEQQHLAALTAHEGTDWERLLPN